MKMLLRIAALAAVILAVPSCVYPFEPEIQGEDSRLVVEGDIHIGSTSTFSFSRVYRLDADDYSPSPLKINGYIEGEDGRRLDGQQGLNSLHFDTTGLPSTQRYMDIYLITIVVTSHDRHQRRISSYSIACYQNRM